MIKGSSRGGRGSKITWEPDDEAYLREHIATDSLDDIGMHFGISAPTVSFKAREMGLVNPRKVRPREWTKEETDYLVFHFPNECGRDIADHLGVSSTLVCRRAKELGLKKSAGYDRRRYNKRYVRDYVNVGIKN